MITFQIYFWTEHRDSQGDITETSLRMRGVLRLLRRLYPLGIRTRWDHYTSELLDTGTVCTRLSQSESQNGSEGTTSSSKNSWHLIVSGDGRANFHQG